MKKKIARSDRVGLKFNLLTVLDVALGFAVCRCDCGNVKQIRSGNVFNGHTKSCGCARWRLKHGGCSGGRSSRVYRIYGGMIQRCTNPANVKYHLYGGRGITICDRWLESFGNFLMDMGSRPNGTSLDRINSNGNYEPSNCRWATQDQQHAGRRNTVMLEWGGERVPFAELAKRFGMQINVLRSRLNRGWPLERALTVRVGAFNRWNSPINKTEDPT